MESGPRVLGGEKQRLLVGDKLYATCDLVSEPLMADTTDVLCNE